MSSPLRIAAGRFDGFGVRRCLSRLRRDRLARDRAFSPANVVLSRIRDVANRQWHRQNLATRVRRGQCAGNRCRKSADQWKADL